MVDWFVPNLMLYHACMDACMNGVVVETDSINWMDGWCDGVVLGIEGFPFF